MVKQTVLVCAVLLSLTGCVTYGGQRFIPSPEQEAAMQADSRRVQNDERAERAERRRERREEMMDEADAINRAYGNKKSLYPSLIFRFFRISGIYYEK